MKTAILLFILLSGFSNLYAQNVGIGTASPQASALLHVDLGASSSKGVLFSSSYTGPSIMPDLGAGTRFMFYAGRAAFRAGKVEGTQWDNVNMGLTSMAVGYNTIASGSASTAMGSSTTASGVYSTAMGFSTTATTNGATAMGNQTTANGQYSTAMGRNTIADGTSSTGMGHFTTASGNYSTTMGIYSKAKGFASTVVGAYNDTILTTNQTILTSNTPLFIVGNGNSINDRSNAMVVLKNGFVGIGTNTPTENLVLNDPLNPSMELQRAGVAKGYFQLSGDNVRLGTYSSNNTGNLIVRLNGADRFTILPSGNATLTGTLTQNSDARLKKNIFPIKNAMQQLNQVNGYHYHWKNPTADPAMQSGVLAQELQKVFPELVKEDAEGTLSVNYSGLLPYMIEAAKTQQQEINELRKRLFKLEEILLKSR